MSNFEFLNKEFPELAKWGISAEKKLYDAPVDALKDIGLLCEKMVKEICDYYGIVVEQKLGITQIRIDELKKENIITREQAKILHAIRIKRNKATHEGEGTVDDCLELFPSAYEFSAWFANTFGRLDYRLGNYIVPDPTVSKKGDTYYVDPPTNEHDVEIARIQRKKESQNGFVKVFKWFLLFTLALTVLLFVVIGIGAYNEEKASDREQMEYSNAVEEAEMLIKDGKFDAAETAIEKIWPSPTIPADINDETEQQRASLIIKLEEEKAKAKGKPVPVYSIPRSSKSFKGDNYRDVAMELSDSGFVQIYSSRADQDSSLLHRKNTVMRISIDGTSEFDEGDQFSKTAKIVIYYYA